jgi:hypothetical protein
MALKLGASVGVGQAMGNPGLRPDGTTVGNSAPVPATPTTAALASAGREPMREAQAAFDQRMPPVISPRSQAEASGANYGDVGEAATAGQGCAYSERENVARCVIDGKRRSRASRHTVAHQPAQQVGD